MDHKAALYQIIFILCSLWPGYVICRRAGIHPLWILTLCVPLFGLVLFSSALAFTRWSNVAPRQATT